MNWGKRSMVLFLAVSIVLVALLGSSFSVVVQPPFPVVENTTAHSSATVFGATNYDVQAAVAYAWLIHTKYYHTAQYPSGLSPSVMQENLDHNNSEDCAHFVSQALIAGGLKALAYNPAPYASFNKSYGLVNVYMLSIWLAGYNLPIFPLPGTSAYTDLHSQGVYWRPPPTYNGTPEASVYYVTNESMLPSYFLSPGDVIVDGGVGDGHVVLYVGNGNVIQTDPANYWTYQPGLDLNISTGGMMTYNGKNVSAMYIHIPTFHGPKGINITTLYDGHPLKNSSSIRAGSSIYMIGSFPYGVGRGNYTYRWTDNGKVVSTQQNFTFQPKSQLNNIELQSTGSNGTAYQNFTVYSKSQASSGLNGVVIAGVIVAAIAVVVAVSIVMVHRKRIK